MHRERVLRPAFSPIISAVRENIIKLPKKASVIQFIKFGLVGVSNTLISLLAYYIVLRINTDWYLAGNAAGWVISVANRRARLHRLGPQNIYPSIVGSHEYLCRQYGLGGQEIASTVARLLA